MTLNNVDRRDPVWGLEASFKLAGRNEPSLHPNINGKASSSLDSRRGRSSFHKTLEQSANDIGGVRMMMSIYGKFRSKDMRGQSA